MPLSWSEPCTVESIALVTLHESPVPTPWSCHNAVIRIPEVVETAPSEDIISIGIAVHAVVSIHGSSTHHSTCHSTAHSIHSNIRPRLCRHSIVARIAIRGLIGHGAPIVVHELWAASIAIWGRSRHYSSVDTASWAGCVGLPIDAGGPSPCVHRSRHWRRRCSSSNVTAPGRNWSSPAWAPGGGCRIGSPARIGRRCWRRAPAGATEATTPTAATSPPSG